MLLQSTEFTDLILTLGLVVPLPPCDPNSSPIQPSHYRAELEKRGPTNTGSCPRMHQASLCRCVLPPRTHPFLLPAASSCSLVAPCHRYRIPLMCFLPNTHGRKRVNNFTSEEREVVEAESSPLSTLPVIAATSRVRYPSHSLTQQAVGCFGVGKLNK